MSSETAFPWYSGSTTFLKSPQANFEDIKPGMVAIGGAPHDSTHGHRRGPGTAHGASARGRRCWRTNCVPPARAA